MVEVSGKQNLGFDGKVDTSAANGTGGSLLLDPDFIVIKNGGPVTGDGEITGDGSLSTTSSSEAPEGSVGGSDSS